MKFSARKPSLSRMRGISRERKKGKGAAMVSEAATAAVVAEAEESSTFQAADADTRDDNTVGYVRHKPSASGSVEEEDGGERQQEAEADLTTAVDMKKSRTPRARNGAANDRGRQESDTGDREEAEADPSFPAQDSEEPRRGVLFASGSALDSYQTYETYETKGRTDTDTALASYDQTSTETGNTTSEDEETDRRRGRRSHDRRRRDRRRRSRRRRGRTIVHLSGSTIDEGTGTDTDGTDTDDSQNYVQELLQEGSEGGGKKEEAKADSACIWSLPCCDPICFGSFPKDSVDDQVIMSPEARDGRIKELESLLELDEAREAGSRRAKAEAPDAGGGDGPATEENAEDEKDIWVEPVRHDPWSIGCMSPFPVDQGKEVAEKELRARMELEKKKTGPPPSEDEEGPSSTDAKKAPGGGDAASTSSRKSRSSSRGRSRRSASSRTSRLSSILKNNPGVKVSIAKDQFMDTMKAKTSRAANNRDAMSVPSQGGSLGKPLSVLGRIRSSSKSRDNRTHDYFQIVISKDHTDIMIRLPANAELTFKDLRRGIEEGVEDELPFHDKFKFTVSKGGMAVSRRQELEWRVRDYDLTKEGMDGSYKRPYRVYIKEDTNKKEPLCSM